MMVGGVVAREDVHIKIRVLREYYKSHDFISADSGTNSLSEVVRIRSSHLFELKIISIGVLG